jgi:predicted metalloprotease
MLMQEQGVSKHLRCGEEAGRVLVAGGYRLSVCPQRNLRCRPSVNPTRWIVKEHRQLLPWGPCR